MVGNEQAAHFKQLKAVLKEMGYDWSDDMTHVAFGLVTKGGAKLSTRKGNVILLEPTVAEAISRAANQIEAKNPKLANKEAVAHAVGVGAIKFYDLKTDRMNGYDFDLEAMVSFEGETGPYVQYAHARINLSCVKQALRQLPIQAIALMILKAGKSLSLSRTSHVSSSVLLITLSHQSWQNLLFTWHKALTNIMRIPVSSKTIQSVTTA